MRAAPNSPLLDPSCEKDRQSIGQANIPTYDLAWRLIRGHPPLRMMIASERTGRVAWPIRYRHATPGHAPDGSTHLGSAIYM